jgi:Zinc finger, C3HC4 type (RING finger)
MSRIDVWIQYKDTRSPFGIEKHCRVSRMIEVISKALGIKITTIKHQRHCKILKTIEDGTKYLQEDCGIIAGDVIIIEGTPISTPNMDNMVKIHLSYEGKVINSIHIHDTCTVRLLRNMVKQTNLFVPDTIKLHLHGQELSSDPLKLIADLGLKDSDTIEITGTFFPIALFNKNLSFLENDGVYPDVKCCICLEQNTLGHVFECGHMNVCDSCMKSYQNASCPVCN